MQSHVPILKAVSKLNLAKTGTLSTVRRDADKQLEANGVADQWIRQWLLMNVIESDGQIRLALNINAIFTAYVNRFGKRCQFCEGSFYPDFSF